MQDVNPSITQLSPKHLEEAIAEALKKHEISADYKAFISTYSLRQDSHGACSAELVITISETNTPTSAPPSRKAIW